jgi:predicted acyltransferase
VGNRTESVDAFRGITVAAMILVNNPGSWNYVYSPLRHAEWNGCTPTDLVFPFFLFIVGVSIHLAYRQRVSDGLTRSVLIKILKRAVLIFAIGLFLTLFPRFNFETVRIPGVLQRISIVFLVCSLLYMKSTWLTQLRIGLVLLLAYYLVMTLVPVPGFGVPSLDPESNLGAWLDRTLLGGHLWAQSKTWDPEGILSTVPAVVTGISGMLTGRMMTSDKPQAEKVTWMFLTGGGLTILGLAWGTVFPINKSLWTSSYVLYTSGIALQFMAAFYWLIDVQGFRSWARPMIWYGMNALFVFALSGILVKILIRIKMTGTNGEETSLWGFLFDRFYLSWLPPHFASFLFAADLVVLFGILLWWMHRKRIFIKV